MKNHAAVGSFVALAVMTVANLATAAPSPTAADLANMRRLTGDWIRVVNDEDFRVHCRLFLQGNVIKIYTVQDKDRMVHDVVFLKGQTQYFGEFILQGRRLLGRKSWPNAGNPALSGFVSEDLGQITWAYPLVGTQPLHMDTYTLRRAGGR